MTGSATYDWAENNPYEETLKYWKVCNDHLSQALSLRNRCLKHIFVRVKQLVIFGLNGIEVVVKP